MTDYEQAIVDAGIPRDELLGGYNFVGRMLKEIQAQDLAGRAAVQRKLPELLSRESFTQRYAFAIPSEEALTTIAELGPILEVGAGTGYWAYELAKCGADVVATDPQPSGNEAVDYGFREAWCPVAKMNALDAIAAHPGRA